MASNKQGGIFSSFIGMLIGIGLVVALSPYLLWQAQSQDRAKEFSTATVVSADGNDNGYIVIEGTATNLSDVKCPKAGAVHQTTPASRSTVVTPTVTTETSTSDDFFDSVVTETSPTPTTPDATDTTAVTAEEEVVVSENCIYTMATKEVYSSDEVEQCGSLEDNQVMVKQIEDQCDEYGENCEKCYLVNEYTWETDKTDSKYSNFTIGAYTVFAEGGANFIGSKSFTDYVYDVSETAPVVGDVRYSYTYLPSDQELLVAGDAEDREIQGAYDDHIFVISNLNYDGTMAELKAQDKAAGWMLRILSLVAMMVGMMLIVGPLTYASNFLRFIPGMGKHLDKGFDGVVKSVAALVGLVLWLIVFGLVMILKNILIVFIVLAVLAAIAVILFKSGKMKFKKQGTTGV